MKQIGLVSYHFYPNFSGPIIRFMKYEKFFKKKKIGFRYFVPFRKKIKKKNVVFINNFYENIHIFFCLLIFQIFSKKNKDLKVLIFLNLSPILIFLNPLFRLLGKKIIFVNTMSSLSNNNKIKNVFKKIFFSFFNQIIVSTNFLKKELLSINLNKKKVIKISNGVIFDKFKCSLSEKKIYKKKLKIKPIFTYLFVGNMTYRKGTLELLKSWKKYKLKYKIQSQLILVGSFPKLDRLKLSDKDNNYFKEILNFKKDQKKLDLKFYDFKKDVSTFFKASDVFCFPSRLEGTPNVLLEAFISKSLVIMNKFQGLSDEIADEKKCYVRINVEQDFSKSLFDVYKNYKNLIYKIENSYNKTMKNQNMELCVNKYIKVINDL